MTIDHTREPCPYNIVADVGIGFCMGTMGGALWYGFKGQYHSPMGEKMRSFITNASTRAPITGGNFAVWSGLFNAMECVIVGVRKKHDSWNPILSGAATGAILAGRSGKTAMMVSAVFGGCILAVMEGIGILVNRRNAAAYKPQAPVLPDHILQAQKEQKEPSNPTTKPGVSLFPFFKSATPTQ